MSKIKSVKAREILDSRGNPTIEVVCEFESGAMGKAAVPSGASTGVHEALELRDGDKKRYNGLGVLTAVRNVNEEIQKHLCDKDFVQQTLDKTLIELDGTENKSRLGANAILGVSLAFARACAGEKNIELYEYLGNLVGTKVFNLPQPMFNIVNGGKHADSGLDIQEFMIAPVHFNTFREKVRAGAEVITSLRKILKNKGYAISVGDEGGFAPKLSSNEEALELIEEAIKDAGYSFDQIKIGVDAAASSFYKNGVYDLKIDGKQTKMSSQEMISWYEKLIDKHPILFIEDGLAEDDWFGFTFMTEMLGGMIKIVGDDLLVTNVKRIKMAIEKRAVNSVLIKFNQIGTLSETIEAIEMAKNQKWIPFISHRSGETTDTFIADLAVGLSCNYIKSGSLVRGERVCKYNRLMEIEAILSK
ncbi:MAG: phosphopyruvate hydratase [Candidatus Pacebacteria bacterium]|nr:phosphopyruvate hydratase [Candidatus Paceibacterota bacterium]